MKPDVYQQAAIDSVLKRPPLIAIQATAGSGKTKTVVDAVAQLIASGTRPERILCTTFTAKAGKEFSARLRAAGVSPAPVVGTFHSVGRRTLSEGNLWAMARCCDVQEPRSPVASTRKIWQTCLGWSRGGVLGLPGVKHVDNAGVDAKAAMGLVTLFRGHGWTTKSRKPRAHLMDLGLSTKLMDAWKLYERAKASLGLWDFDDLLEHYNDYAKGCKSYDVVFVDEAQDNSPVQWSIARRLAGDGTLVAVGDALQSIYAFRGASPEDFLKHCKQARGDRGACCTLANNYRSRAEIVGVAERLSTGHLSDWHPGSTVNAPRGRGGKVATVVGDGVIQMGMAMAADVKAQVDAGLPLSEVAVLTRTNADASLLATSLGAAKIPYILEASGGSIFSSFRGLCFLAYLVLSETDHFAALDKVWNYPNRYLDRGLLERVAEAQDRDMSQPLSVCVRAAGFTVAGRKRESAKVFAMFLSRIRSEDWSTSIDTIVRMLRETDKIAAVSPDDDKQDLWDVLRDLAKRFTCVADFSDYITRAEEMQERNRKAGAEAVVVSTIHRSKGREWNRVYVHTSAGMLPFKRAETEAEMKEEYRLAYVAFTRPKDSLVMMWANKDLEGKDSGPSALTEELLGLVPR